jgi:putative molybdopterin biosynthesis protein
MDGFALRSEDTQGAMPTAPVTLAVGEKAAYVDTGDPLPDWANAVVPIEQVEALTASAEPAVEMRSPASIRLRAALAPWMHVRPLGEDIIATQLVLPAGHILRPVDFGAVAASGHTQLRVYARPRVAILPTGTELVPVGQAVRRGDIIEFNSIVLAAQLKQWGADPVRYPITSDDFDQLAKTVQAAAESSDLVLVNAGSSAGSEDFTAEVVETLGELLVHGVAVRPGHPVILGMLSRQRDGSRVPVIGIPGYPVSAALTGEIFVEPLISLWLGRMPSQPVEIEAHLTRKVTSPAGDDDYMRVVVGQVGDRLLAAPLSRGAGVITSLVRSDGITIIPRGVQGLEAGSPVKVRLYRPAHDLQQTIFAIGSHDMTLDLLAQFLSVRGRRLVSANVGSQGGLVALRRGETHMAGSHLLDPDTGDYNLCYLQQYLPNLPVQLVTWVGREQGLIIAKNNPKGIHSLEDLVRPEINYINRQRGAGTRVLLDYHLGKLGIEPDAVKGYSQEEYTHLGVAAAVASGRADCGLGVTAAARALDLDFIPLYEERYDLVIPCSFAESELLKPVYELMHTPAFRDAVAAMPGYDVSRMGEIVQPC